MARLISPTAVKKYTKELLTKERPKYTRVSQDFVDHFEAFLKSWIKSYVGTYTGPGKTLMPPGGTVIPPRQQNRFVREHVFVGEHCKYCGIPQRDMHVTGGSCIRRKV